jgi:chemotaxis protein MotA
MSIPTVLGLIGSLAAVVISLLMEGGNLGAFVNPSALLVVFGGTFGATLVSFPSSTVKKLPGLMGRAFKKERADVSAVGQTLLRLAERARREGLLALEEELDSINDPYLKRGVLLVVDGTDPDLVRGILESDLTVRESELEAEGGLFEAMGGYAPTMGIIGTVMGLVNVLGNLTDPSKLGEAIAVAFIATFYGVGSANLIWLPIGAKLKKHAEAEKRVAEMIMEGLASIQNGENPRILQERLDAYLPKRAAKPARQGDANGNREGAQEEFQPA